MNLSGKVVFSGYRWWIDTPNPPPPGQTSYPVGKTIRNHPGTNLLHLAEKDPARDLTAIFTSIHLPPTEWGVVLDNEFDIVPNAPRTWAGPYPYSARVRFSEFAARQMGAHSFSLGKTRNFMNGARTDAGGCPGAGTTIEEAVTACVKHAVDCFQKDEVHLRNTLDNRGREHAEYIRKPQGRLNLLRSGLGLPPHNVRIRD